MQFFSLLEEPRYYTEFKQSTGFAGTRKSLFTLFGEKKRKGHYSTDRVLKRIWNGTSKYP